MALAEPAAPLLETFADTATQRVNGLEDALNTARAERAAVARMLLDNGYTYRRTAELLRVSIQAVQDMIRRTGGR